MINETELAYAEVDAILELLEDEYLKKIPAQVREFFKKEKNKEYRININAKIGLDEQNLKDETISILTLLQINYLCDSEEEKQEILNELYENDRLKEEELREKYNPDNIFKSKVKIDKNINSENVAIMKYRECSIIKRILDKILRLLKR